MSRDIPTIIKEALDDIKSITDIHYEYVKVAGKIVAKPYIPLKLVEFYLHHQLKDGTCTCDCCRCGNV